MVADIERPFSKSLNPPLDTEIAFWVPSFSYIFCSQPLISELIFDFNGAEGNNVMIIKISEKKCWARYEHRFTMNSFCEMFQSKGTLWTRYDFEQDIFGKSYGNKTSRNLESGKTELSVNVRKFWIKKHFVLLITDSELKSFFERTIHISTPAVAWRIL